MKWVNLKNKNSVCYSTLRYPWKIETEFTNISDGYTKKQNFVIAQEHM